MELRSAGGAVLALRSASSTGVMPFTWEMHGARLSWLSNARKSAIYIRDISRTIFHRGGYTLTSCVHAAHISDEHVQEAAVLAMSETGRVRRGRLRGRPALGHDYRPTLHI